MGVEGAARGCTSVTSQRQPLPEQVLPPATCIILHFTTMKKSCIVKVHRTNKASCVFRIPLFGCDICTIHKGEIHKDSLHIRARIKEK